MNIKNFIKDKKSFLCVGLDPDTTKIGYQPPLEFCKKIIDDTIDNVISYKINTAFFESSGSRGWEEMEYLFDYLQGKGVFIIADAKRGDIGSTSNHYVKAFCDNLKCDAVTLNPLMGRDSVEPFLDRGDKVSIFLGLTSNPDSSQFFLKDFGGEKLYESILKETLSWESKSEKMWVIGATRNDQFKKVRDILPNQFLLVPGVGHQGGSLKDVIVGLNTDNNILINMSRSIIFSNNPKEESKRIQKEMARYIQ